MIRHMFAALLIAAPGAIILEAGTAEAAAVDREWNGCRYEDGSGQRRCVWDARHMGDGAGDSLVIRRGGTVDAVYRVVTHRRAHRLLNGGE